MGSKDSSIWLHMMCITESQEKSIMQYFKRRKWKTDWLVRIPDNHLSDGVELFKKIVGSTKIFEKLESQLHKQALFSQREHGPSSSPKEIVVNNDSFRQVGIFDEVFKLVETNKHVNIHVTDTEQGKSRCKKRKTRKSMVRACKNIDSVQSKCSETLEEECCMHSSEEENEPDERILNYARIRTKIPCQDKYNNLRHYSKITVEKSDNRTLPANVIDTEEVLVDFPYEDANIDKCASTEHDAMISENMCKGVTMTVYNDNRITLVEPSHYELSSPCNKLTKVIDSRGEADNMEGDSRSGRGKRKHSQSNHKIENVNVENEEILECKAKSSTSENPEAHSVVAKKMKCSDHKSNNPKEHQAMSGCEVQPHIPTIPVAPLAHTRKRKRGTKLKSLQERRELLRCVVCGRVMASEQFYKRHMRLMHSEEALRRRADLKQLKRDTKVVQACTICHKQFVNKSGLQTHMTRIHGDDKTSYQCDLCGAVLKFKGNLIQHMKSVHTDARPYPCLICHKRFKVLHQLKNHERRHDPDYIDTCVTCGKTIKKGQLTAHMRRHADIRPHKCTSCEKSFFEKQDLERHLRIHSGEKPYKCPHCNYASTMRGNLTKHLKHVKHKLETRTYVEAERRAKQKLDPNTCMQTESRIRHKHETEIYTQTEDHRISDIGIELGRSRTLDEGSASAKLYSYSKVSGIKSSERYDNGTPIHVLSRDRQCDRAYFINHDHRQQQQQLEQSPYQDQADASPDSYSVKLKHLENSNISEVATSSVNEMSHRFHANSVELYPSHMQIEVPLILADNVHIPVSHVEVTKVVPSSEQSEIDTEGEVGPGYNEETSLYTLKPAGDVSYVEENRQYGEGPGSQKPSLPGMPQFKENYLKYMMSRGQDSRYPYTQH